MVRPGFETKAVEKINDALRAVLPLDEFRSCYHDTADRCGCRKPNPGALLAAAAQHDIDLRESCDRWRDTEAGQSAGCKIIFLDYGYQEKQPEVVDYRVKSLSEAAEIILR
jgi:D-glycero-D-manno-heptose 1,7-bisphosphate phosphatase